MINKNTAFRSLLFGGILLSGLMFGACQIIPNNPLPNNSLPTPVIDEEDEPTAVEDEGVSIVRNSDIVITDITDKDYATIDYVNTHSDYVFLLLGEMKNGVVMQDVGNLYGEASNDSLVKSYAEHLDEYDKKVITQINLSEKSDYHILGVHCGDTYKDAKENLEKEGFELINDVSYGKSFTLSSYEKGCVHISVSTTISDDVILEDQVIKSITASVSLVDLERVDNNANDGLFVTVSDRNSKKPVAYTPNVGDEVYNGFSSTVTVKSVSDDEIKFELTGCLIEANSDGTVNLNGKALKELTLKKGEKIKLKSMTMDAGVTIVLEYK